MNDAEVAAYIGGWQPVLVPPQAAVLARAAVRSAGPHGRKRANALLWSAARLASFAASLGLELVPEVVFHPSVIERFALAAPGLSDSARRTLRTNQRFIARRVVPQLHPPDAALPRERAKAPYSPAEIAGYLALAAAQPAAGRRARAAGLVCLGAGAGLIRGDLRQIRGTDVMARSGGVIVQVRGARPRAVPVLARYHEPLLAAAGVTGAGLLTGGTGTDRKNVTARLNSSLAGGGGLPRLDTSRLRATWLRECAEILGLATFLHAAGISCSQRLGDLIAGLDPGGEAEAVRLLGAARRP